MEKKRNNRELLVSHMQGVNMSHLISEDLFVEFHKRFYLMYSRAALSQGSKLGSGLSKWLEMELLTGGSTPHPSHYVSLSAIAHLVLSLDLGWSTSSYFDLVGLLATKLSVEQAQESVIEAVELLHEHPDYEPYDLPEYKALCRIGAGCQKLFQAWFRGPFMEMNEEEATATLGRLGLHWNQPGLEYDQAFLSELIQRTMQNEVQGKFFVALNRWLTPMEDDLDYDAEEKVMVARGTSFPYAWPRYVDWMVSLYDAHRGQMDETEGKLSVCVPDRVGSYMYRPVSKVCLSLLVGCLLYLRQSTSKMSGTWKKEHELLYEEFRGALDDPHVLSDVEKVYQTASGHSWEMATILDWMETLLVKTKEESEHIDTELYVRGLFRRVYMLWARYLEDCVKSVGNHVWGPII